MACCGDSPPINAAPAVIVLNEAIFTVPVDIQQWLGSISGLPSGPSCPIFVSGPSAPVSRKWRFRSRPWPRRRYRSNFHAAMVGQFPTDRTGLPLVTLATTLRHEPSRLPRCASCVAALGCRSEPGFGRRSALPATARPRRGTADGQAASRRDRSNQPRLAGKSFSGGVQATQTLAQS